MHVVRVQAQPKLVPHADTRVGCWPIFSHKSRSGDLSANFRPHVNYSQLVLFPKVRSRDVYNWFTKRPSSPLVATLTICNSIIWSQLDGSIVACNSISMPSHCLHERTNRVCCMKLELWKILWKEDQAKLHYGIAWFDRRIIATFKNEYYLITAMMTSKQKQTIRHSEQSHRYTFSTFPSLRCASAKLGFNRIASYCTWHPR